MWCTPLRHCSTSSCTRPLTQRLLIIDSDCFTKASPVRMCRHNGRHGVVKLAACHVNSLLATQQRSYCFATAGNQNGDGRTTHPPTRHPWPGPCGRAWQQWPPSASQSSIQTFNNILLLCAAYTGGRSSRRQEQVSGMFLPKWARRPLSSRKQQQLHSGITGS